ncbi:PilZ domain-containing protein [Thiohalocapsa sp.]|jgi:type IV pilus assembly protein PilZ|uniref:PilZ domain-containing protein n=1 Tax=Thiohalocapsa sp. TaxID=2497641 RepID=UPI0025FE1546|nr:PilZ domain-containing protein [Thiohalocapsa sp.]
MDSEPRSGRQRILSLAIKDTQALHAAYMPYVRNGGLFIPTSTPYSLGDELFLLLQLLDEKERIPVAGTVVWITPVGAEGNRQIGIGIQFSDQDKGDARRKIEAYLDGGLEAERPTHTM